LKVKWIGFHGPKPLTLRHLPRALDFLNWWLDTKLGVDPQLKFNGFFFGFWWNHRLLRVFSKIYDKEIVWAGTKPLSPAWRKNEKRFAFWDMFNKPWLFYWYVLDVGSFWHRGTPLDVAWNMQFLPTLSHELLHYGLYVKGDKLFYSKPDWNCLEREYYNEDYKQVKPDFRDYNFVWVVQRWPP